MSSIHRPECDSIELMKQIAKLANIQDMPIQKMVLVLDIHDIPRLYIQGLLSAEAVKNNPLEYDGKIKVSEGNVDVAIDGPNIKVIEYCNEESDFGSGICKLVKGHHGLHRYTK